MCIVSSLGTIIHCFSEMILDINEMIIVSSLDTVIKLFSG